MNGLYFFAVNFMKNVKNIQYISGYTISETKCDSIRELFKFRLLKTEKKLGEKVFVASPLNIFDIDGEFYYDDCFRNNIWFKIVKKNELFPWKRL